MFLSLEIRYRLKCLSDSTATFSKLSFYGQSQGHRNNKLAQNVSLFLIFKIMCSRLLVIVSLSPTPPPQKKKKKGCGDGGHIAFGSSVRAYVLKSFLFINLFLKSCFVWKKCTLMCTYSHKLEEMALNLLENHIFQYTKTPTHFAESW